MNGLPGARDMPIGAMLSEHEIIRKALGMQAAQDAMIMQMCIASMFSKDAGKEFTKMIKGLINE